ncbi:hypothetical protein [Cumulibacter manganitolerans]|uniref:hypothetical protein n=1 Tax=Cumulibacter manganitolerans TaxID=1884992 RepID=UPI001297C24B|nr:hypothetical protein [Cumulibacter manganitolerans]
MSARPPAAPIDRRTLLQWTSLVLLVLTALIFMTREVQQPTVTFAAVAKDTPPKAAAAQPAPPSYDAIVAEYGGQRIIRLPGAVAQLDEAAVTPWLDAAGASRVVLAPPRDPDDSQRMDVPDDVVLVTGTSASLSPYDTFSTTFAEVGRTLGAADVTSDVITLAAAVADRDDDVPEAAPLPVRAPTAEETAAVVADLADDGLAFVGGAPAFDRPAGNGFAAPPLIVVTPYVAPGTPAVDYREPVTAAYPGRTVVLMTGLWIQYAGAGVDELAPAITASFYGQLEDRLRKYAYSQESVLAANLARVEQFRTSGMFDLDAPYVAPDPLHLTLPVLPWVCGGLALVLLGAAAWPRRPLGTTRVSAASVSRYAGLSELAVEISALVPSSADGAFTRSGAALRAVRDGLDDATLTDDDLGALLERAESELATVAARLQRADLEPARYLARRDEAVTLDA